MDGTSNGIFITGEDASVRGNTLVNVGGHGIYANGYAPRVITDNHLIDPSCSSNGTYNGIYIRITASTDKSTVISNNFLEGHFNYSIATGDYLNNVLCLGNWIYYKSPSQMYINGTGGVIEHNKEVQ